MADEAVTALDANVQRHVLETLLSLREHTDLAILFISHDLDTVRRIADRIAVMVDGRIIEEGATAEVMDHPKHEYTRKLIASVPRALPLDTANTADTADITREGSTVNADATNAAAVTDTTATAGTATIANANRTANSVAAKESR